MILEHEYIALSYDGKRDWPEVPYNSLNMFFCEIQREGHRSTKGTNHFFQSSRSCCYCRHRKPKCKLLPQITVSFGFLEDPEKYLQVQYQQSPTHTKTSTLGPSACKVTCCHHTTFARDTQLSSRPSSVVILKAQLHTAQVPVWKQLRNFLSGSLTPEIVQHEVDELGCPNQGEWFTSINQGNGGKTLGL